MKVFYFIYITLFKIIEVIPVKISGYIFSRLALLVYYIDWKHRNIAIENLKMAFGEEKSLRDIETIAKKVFQNLSLIFLDFCRIPKITKNNLKDLITFEYITYVWE